MSLDFTQASKRSRMDDVMVAFRLLHVSLLICAAIATGFLLKLMPARRSQSISWFSLIFCKFACRALGIKVIVEGAPPADRPALLISNHVSWTDIIGLGSITPVCFLARHDVAQWPGLGILARLYGTLFVERGRLRQIPSVNAAMADRMAAGDLVTLFPEATTGDGTRLRSFHAVHIAAARDLLASSDKYDCIAVAPAAIAYSHRCGIPLGRAEKSTVAWYGDSDFAPHLLDLLRFGGVECRISFLSPLLFTRSSDRKATARAARASIREVLTRMQSENPEGGRRSL